jgi:uncharacterized damage-inducible protein DinB
MDVLQELLRHNRWANARVFKVCLRAEVGLLEDPATGTVGTIDDSLRHMVSVEEAFGSIIAASRKDDFEYLVTDTGLADGYFKHELAWYEDRAAALDNHFIEVAAAATAEELGTLVVVPWMPFKITVLQCLMQVLVHDGHHRSQVFSALGERGVKVPDLDYIIMLAKEQTPAAT